MRAIALPVFMFVLVLAGCGKGAPANDGLPAKSSGAPAPSASPVARTGSSGAEPAPVATSDADDVADVGARLDFAELDNRDDPARLLRFYSQMVHNGMFAVAARAWDADAGMTGERLKAMFGGPKAVTLSFGKGDQEGAAGSLYYQAPVTADFADGRKTVRGTITLRRVNDVPGASEEQLNWRIETSTLAKEGEAGR